MKRLWIFIVTVFILGGLFFTIPSQEVKATRKKPAKVTKLKVTNVDYDTLKITWKKVAGAKKYEVYRSQSAKGTYQKIGIVTATSYNDSELSAGQQYFYKVRAYRVVNNTN